MDPADLVEVDLQFDKNKRCLDRWMEKLPEEAHSLPLHCLAIPGSHDSLSSSLTPHSDISPDDPGLYNSFFIRATSCLSKRIIYNWCCTQTLDCKQQLEAGIRYFDLRVAKRADDGELYIVHGLYGTETKNILEAMYEFLTTHSKEVILLDFQHLYEMNHFDHHKLLHQLTETFGAMLCPYVADLTEFTLSWLWERGFQVVVFYRDTVAQYHPFLWPGESIPNPWPNTRSIKNLLAFLTIDRRREAGKFFVSQAILTPNLFLILRNLLGNLRSVLVSDCNKQLLKWLEDKHPGPHGLNIVICDFIDYDDCAIPQSIVNLNYKSPVLSSHMRRGYEVV
ncbi:PI-PLC X domain-containing protein 3-like [Stegodyphus dumicola]|uniref:PI-PLC X domain-containing protein 3-like n=1 Tax=Stegodyphus dumicola TaxID=202533 RepID=UPI0015B25FDA|nr:PI-PLC X domain-containing protein 3-like [Stegodyphus dumicola]